MSFCRTEERHVQTESHSGSQRLRNGRLSMLRPGFYRTEQFQGPTRIMPSWRMPGKRRLVSLQNWFLPNRTNPKADGRDFNHANWFLPNRTNFKDRIVGTSLQGAGREGWFLCRLVFAEQNESKDRPPGFQSMRTGFYRTNEFQGPTRIYRGLRRAGEEKVGFSAKLVFAEQNESKNRRP